MRCCRRVTHVIPLANVRHGFWITFGMMRALLPTGVAPTVENVEVRKMDARLGLCENWCVKWQMSLTSGRHGSGYRHCGSHA